MNNEQKKAFIAEGREANTAHGNHADFWKLCVRFDERPAFSKMWEESETVEDFENRILSSGDPEIVLSQAYAELSRLRDGHWYRLRAMLGSRVKKTYSDAGSLAVGCDQCRFYIPNRSGDGVMRYAVVEKGEWNHGMADFYTMISGDLDIYDCDCGYDISETISGRFGIYVFEGIVILERWN
nr:MAG TPA: hypothetical protein [Caudoviricetes sp.]